MTAQPQILAPHGGADPYGPGKLKPEAHSRLVLELDRIAYEAGINASDITGETYGLRDDEIEYLTGFNRAAKEGRLGIIYIGQHDPLVAERCRSICGALIRNFTECRMITQEELVSELLDKRRQPNVDLVAIPNLSLRDAPVSHKRTITAWLSGRMARQQQTVIGVPNQNAIKELFGSEGPIYMKHFKVLTGVQAPG